MEIRVALRESAAATHGPIVYVTRVPAGAPPPDPQVRSAIARSIPEFAASCSSYHVILEGDGFAAACKRGVLLSLFQLTTDRKKFRVHSRADEILERLDPHARAVATKLLENARKGGLLERECVSIPVNDPRRKSDA